MGWHCLPRGISQNFPLNLLTSSILCQGSSTCFHLLKEDIFFFSKIPLHFICIFFWIFQRNSFCFKGNNNDRKLLFKGFQWLQDSHFLFSLSVSLFPPYIWSTLAHLLLRITTNEKFNDKYYKMMHLDDTKMLSKKLYRSIYWRGCG